ncbi:MAG TPA: nitrite reductase small subunit NirD [Acidimicrobiales bacterium]|jgi:nitrite reductase (NADH) small subunit|nr:nitrite reductase small subunit NirD [Acidimicrobiales bacterium]
MTDLSADALDDADLGGSPATPASAARWTKVCGVDALRRGSGVAALVAGRQIAMFLTDDGVIYALDNVDPAASGAPVLSRGLLGDTAGRKYVASPMYKHRYDLATGECLTGGDPVASHDVRVHGGAVFVGTGR